MISYIKNIIDNIKFAWKCWKLYRKINKAIQNIPSLDDETAFKGWIDENILYLTEFLTYTATDIDDVVIEQVNILVQYHWKLLYSIIQKAGKGENPSILELSTIVSSFSEASKVGNATAIATLMLITNIISIIQKRKENNDKEERKGILKRIKERRQN